MDGYSVAVVGAKFSGGARVGVVANSYLQCLKYYIYPGQNVRPCCLIVVGVWRACDWFRRIS